MSTRTRTYRTRRASFAPPSAPSLDRLPAAPHLLLYVWRKPTTTPTISRATLVAPRWLRPAATLAGLMIILLLLMALSACAGPLQEGPPDAGANAGPVDAAPVELPTMAPPSEMPPLANPRPTDPAPRPAGQLTGWWEPGTEGVAVAVDSARIVGWLATCPAHPNMILTLLVDGTQVWLFWWESGVPEDSRLALPRLGGVCEVQ